VPKYLGDPLCPVAALAAWVDYAEITAGAVFVTLSPVAGKGGRLIPPLEISRRLEAIAANAGAARQLAHPLPAPRRGDIGRGGRASGGHGRGWKSDAMFGSTV
jgi:hypothetical protein